MQAGGPGSDPPVLSTSEIKSSSSSISKPVDLFIYYMAFLGLHCCARAFSSCGEWGLLSLAVRKLLTVVASLVVTRGPSRCGSQALERGLGSCGAWA